MPTFKQLSNAMAMRLIVEKYPNRIFLKARCPVGFNSVHGYWSLGDGMDDDGRPRGLEAFAVEDPETSPFDTIDVFHAVLALWPPFKSSEMLKVGGVRYAVGFFEADIRRSA